MARFLQDRDTCCRCPFYITKEIKDDDNYTYVNSAGDGIREVRVCKFNCGDNCGCLEIRTPTFENTRKAFIAELRETKERETYHRKLVTDLHRKIDRLEFIIGMQEAK
jgi:hypothetical protein